MKTIPRWVLSHVKLPETAYTFKLTTLQATIFLPIFLNKFDLSYQREFFNIWHKIGILGKMSRVCTAYWTHSMWKKGTASTCQLPCGITWLHCFYSYAISHLQKKRRFKYFPFCVIPLDKSEIRTMSTCQKKTEEPVAFFMHILYLCAAYSCYQNVSLE